MRIVVHADALAGLVTRLRAVRDFVTVAPRLSCADVGHDEIREALADFDSTWTRRQRALCVALEEAAGLLVDVVRDFAAADSELARGLGGGRGGTA